MRTRRHATSMTRRWFSWESGGAPFCLSTPECGFVSAGRHVDVLRSVNRDAVRRAELASVRGPPFASDLPDEARLVVLPDR